MTSKSFIAKIEEFILKLTKPKYMDLQQEIGKFLDEKSKTSKNNIKSIFKSTDFNGMQVFTFGNPQSENIILFIHGGAYVNEINYQHQLYCLLLSKKIDAYVLAPVYPLAPNHSSSDSYEKITQLYENLMKNNKNITLMGDSAGGGFVLSFAQYLNKINLSQPNHIIAISPWVDISMSNTPYDNDNDPILGEVGLKEIGKKWAGKLDTKDYRVSPLYGDNTNLAKTLITAGTNEIFYKDILQYVKNMKNDNVDVKLIVGDEMFHIYPMFPNSEAKTVFKEIKKEIKD